MLEGSLVPLNAESLDYNYSTGTLRHVALVTDLFINLDYKFSKLQYLAIGECQLCFTVFCHCPQDLEK